MSTVNVQEKPFNDYFLFGFERDIANETARCSDRYSRPSKFVTPSSLSQEVKIWNKLNMPLNMEVHYYSLTAL